MKNLMPDAALYPGVTLMFLGVLAELESVIILGGLILMYLIGSTLVRHVREEK